MKVKNELGDLLLHIVFYAKIGSEQNAFDIGDVANSISDKLIHRHPHIYGDTLAEDEATVKAKLGTIKTKRRQKLCFRRGSKISSCSCKS